VVQVVAWLEAIAPPEVLEEVLDAAGVVEQLTDGDVLGIRIVRHIPGQRIIEADRAGHRQTADNRRHEGLAEAAHGEDRVRRDLLLGERIALPETPYQTVPSGNTIAAEIPGYEPVLRMVFRAFCRALSFVLL